MPMRFLIYAGGLYDKYTHESSYNKYSGRLQPIPTPKCVCFYNGKAEQPERTVLRLSQAYRGFGDIEVEVSMLNINYGKNQKLMDSCEPLREYAWFVDKARFHQDKLNSIDAAVQLAIKEMPDEFILKAFLVAHYSEVKGMFLTEYDEEKTLRLEREEAREERNFEVACDMLKKGTFSISLISELSKLSEDAVRDIAVKLGITPLDDLTESNNS